MDVHVLSEKEAPLLHAFVSQHPWGSVEQTWAWGTLQCTLHGRPEFRVFGLFEGDAMVGSMLVVRQDMGFGKTWLWCPRGPLLPEGRETEAWGLLRAACQNWARLHGDVFLRVEPGSAAGRVEWGGRATEESYVPRHTLVLDLELSEEKILEQMTQKGRYNIKVAEKHHVQVREGKTQDLEGFYRVFQETAGRDGFAVHPKAFYADFLHILGDDAAFLVATVDGVLVGGLLETFCGQTATYYFGASASTHRDAMAPYALQWAAIREARRRGKKVYDFLGIAPEGEPAHALAGVTQFKTRFGGQRLDYENAQVFVLRPVWWLLYKWAKFLRRFWSA